MSGNTHIFRVSKFPTNAFQIIVAATRTAAFLFCNGVFMDDNGKGGDDFFLCPLLASFVTMYFYGFRFGRLRSGRRGILTEKAQLLHTACHGSYTNLSRFSCQSKAAAGSWSICVMSATRFSSCVMRSSRCPLPAASVPYPAQGGDGSATSGRTSTKSGRSCIPKPPVVFFTVYIRRGGLKSFWNWRKFLLFNT